MTTLVKRKRGRPKGSWSKITGDLIELLNSKGFNPAAKLVDVYEASWKEYERASEIHDRLCDNRIAHELPIINYTEATDYLLIAEKAAGQLMQYCFPKRKAVEHTISEEVKELIEYRAEWSNSTKSE